jgi:hypothetical protein
MDSLTECTPDQITEAILGAEAFRTGNLSNSLHTEAWKHGWEMAARGLAQRIEPEIVPPSSIPFSPTWSGAGGSTPSDTHASP